MQTGLEYLKVIKKFPLHIHWIGALPLDFVHKKVKEKGIELKLPKRDYYGNLIIYRSPNGKIISNKHLLNSFLQSPRRYNPKEIEKVPLSLMQSSQDLFDAAVAHSKYLNKNNCIYAETRFFVHNHTRQGLSIEDAIESAIEGFKHGKEKFGSDVRLILGFDRELGSEDSKGLMEKYIRMYMRYPSMILGVDPGAENTKHPLKKHYEAMKLTFDTGLKRTIQAGHSRDFERCLKNIREALFDFKADGISHAVSLYKDVSLVDYINEHKIRLEFNPLSNQVNLDLDIHDDLRIDRLVTRGKMSNSDILATINPDKPALMENGTLFHNLFAYDQLYGRTFVEQIVKNSAIASWGIDEQMKHKYVSYVTNLKKKYPVI